MTKIGLGMLMMMFLLIWGCDKDDDKPVDPGPLETKYEMRHFSASEDCRPCHPQYVAEWEASMHKYASHDPIWKLASNSLEHSTGGKLNTFCFQCHAPVAFATKTAPRTFEFSDLPPKVQDGVSCEACHKMLPPHRTTDQIISYKFDTTSTQYGQISDPVPNDFHASAYDPTFERSDKCRDCHDLLINKVPVEVTFMEWQNSPWGAMSVECQDCHMQTYTGRAATNGPIRNNLHRHNMVGVDMAITDFPDKPAQRAEIAQLLENSATLTMTAPATVAGHDSVHLAVTVYNDKTGHNLPTSVFFFRQMWIEVVATQGIDTLYRSGWFDGGGDLQGPAIDPDLALFAGTLYKNGVETNVFELDSLVNNSIPPFASRTATYGFIAHAPGTIDVRVRLMYRPFGPALFRAVGADEYIDEIQLYVMESEQRTITVQ